MKIAALALPALILVGCSVEPNSATIAEARNDCLRLYQAKHPGEKVKAVGNWRAGDRIVVKVALDDGDTSDDAITSGLCLVDLEEDEIEFASNTERAELEK